MTISNAQVIFMTLVVISSLMVHSSCQRPISYQRYSLVRITPITQQHLRYLLNLTAVPGNGLDFWLQTSAVNHSADVMVEPTAIKRLTSNLKDVEMPFKVLIPDIGEVIDDDLEAAVIIPEYYQFFSTYRCIEEISQFVRDKTLFFPEIATMVDIGTSFEGRPLEIIRISGERSDMKPAIWIQGGAHAREQIGPAVVLFIMQKNTVDEPKEDCSDLPPQQRKKKLQQRIEEINCKIQQETSSREGLLKMKGVYEQNPAMGDPASVEGQLADSGQKLEKLQNELQKYQGYLLDADGSALNLSHDHRNSLSEDSLSRSASDSSVSNPNINLHYKNSAPGTPQQSHGSSNSPESGIGTSHPSIADGDADSYPDPEFENEYEYNEEFDAILGNGKALYPFTGQNEGSIDVCEGEEFDIVELDQGDGWTRIRKRNFEEGFVPTSYIETYLYNNC